MAWFGTLLKPAMGNTKVFQGLDFVNFDFEKYR